MRMTFPVPFLVPVLFLTVTTGCVVQPVTSHRSIPHRLENELVFAGVERISETSERVWQLFEKISNQIQAQVAGEPDTSIALDRGGFGLLRLALTDRGLKTLTYSDNRGFDCMVETNGFVRLSQVPIRTFVRFSGVINADGAMDLRTLNLGVLDPARGGIVPLWFEILTKSTAESSAWTMRFSEVNGFLTELKKFGIQTSSFNFSGNWSVLMNDHVDGQVNDQGFEVTAHQLSWERSLHGVIVNKLRIRGALSSSLLQEIEVDGQVNDQTGSQVGVLKIDGQKVLVERPAGEDL